MNIIAIIPARGGSKGIPKKNVVPLAGKPLINWTIEEALKSKYLTSIVLTSDDPEIIEHGKNFRNVKIRERPAILATDEAKSIDVIWDAIQAQKDKKSDCCLLLQPTSPLRKAIDIDNAIEILADNNYEAIVSVCEMDHHPFWSNSLPEDLSLSNFIRAEARNVNRQALPKFYRVNGAIYLAKIDYLLAEGSFFGPGSYAYIMPPERSIDIDNTVDLKVAEVLMNC